MFRVFAFAHVLSLISVFFTMNATSFALSQDTPPSDWVKEKCERYTKGWEDVLSRKGTEGISEKFLENHTLFLASGCLEKVNVCPRLPEELELANIMVLVAMNAGMASTFLPFSCP